MRAPRLFGRRLPWTLVAGALLILLAVLSAALGPRLAGGDPTAVNTEAALQPPSLAHPCGTDNFGRDVMLRVIHAAPLNLQMGLFLMLPAFLIGSALGSVAGYFGGLADTVLMRLVDVLIAFPFTIVMLAFVAFLGPGVSNMVLAGALFGWTDYARLVRGQVLVERRLDYVNAARVLGFGHARVLLGHLMPNVIVQSLVFASSGFVVSMLLSSSLSFLGFGVQPPAPEWGAMIADGRLFVLQAPWISAAPGVALLCTGGAFTLFGDGLADYLRPEVDP